MRIHARPALVDEPTGILIEGCPPGAPVVVHATVDIAGGVYEATATFEADATGCIDTTRSPSRAGTYTGVDPFGLWWSGEPAGPSARDRYAPAQAHVRVRGRVDGGAEAIIERSWLSTGATLQPVDDGGVVGLFARPAGTGPFPAIVGFGGSGGGIRLAEWWAPLLASHGFATLALAYFGLPGLTTGIVRIEVEVVERAVAWLRAREDVRPGPVAVIGQSRGSELGFWAAALLEGVGAVVALAPSGISQCGLGPGGPVRAPAWMFRGNELPYLRPGVPTRPGPPIMLNDVEIPIERSKGPILMVSGEADAMASASLMGEKVERRAQGQGFAHQVVHLHYPDAGHDCAGPPGVPVVTEVARHPLTHAAVNLGGTKAGNARARADSWPQVVEFLRRAAADPLLL